MSSCKSNKEFGSLSEGRKREKAIEIARNEIKKGVSVPADAKVSVEKTEGKYIISFSETSPDEQLGTGYSARVYVDAKSGKVLLVLMPK